MPFISEKLIDSVAENLDTNAENYEVLVRDFQAKQPDLMAFILSEDTLFLTSDERDLLLYLSLIIWKSVAEVVPLTKRIDAEQISEAEDANWAKLENVKSRQFRERIDVFFNQYPQEDLLAFVEDALAPDEESPITNEGREPLFVALKTIIDLTAV